MKKKLIISSLILLVCCLQASEVKGQKKDILNNVDTLFKSILESYKKEPIFIHKQFDMTDEEAIDIIDKMPSFGIFEDSYFVTGISTNHTPTRESSDAKFQLSVRQRLSKSTLPFNTFAYFTYTQKSFWGIYAESSPFRDTNYNPGLGLGRYIIHNKKLIGSAFIQLEHESNGKDGDDSRSWNYLSVSGKYFFNPYLSFNLELWLPYVDGGENKDLLKYRGLGKFCINGVRSNSSFWYSGEINPRMGIGNTNINLSFGYRISSRSNQYLYAQFYNGYGEGLLDYKQHHSFLRLGFCIKPSFDTIF